MSGKIGIQTQREVKIKRMRDGIALRRKAYQHDHNTLSFLATSMFAMPNFASVPVMTFLTPYLAYYYGALGAKFSNIVILVAIAQSINILINPYIAYYSG